MGQQQTRGYFWAKIRGQQGKARYKHSRPRILGRMPNSEYGAAFFHAALYLRSILQDIVFSLQRLPTTPYRQPYIFTLVTAPRFWCTRIGLCLWFSIYTIPLSGLFTQQQSLKHSQAPISPNIMAFWLMCRIDKWLIHFKHTAHPCCQHVPHRDLRG